jgi:hypothetical protein
MITQSNNIKQNTKEADLCVENSPMHRCQLCTELSHIVRYGNATTCLNVTLASSTKLWNYYIRHTIVVINYDSPAILVQSEHPR